FELIRVAAAVRARLAGRARRRFASAPRPTRPRRFRRPPPQPAGAEPAGACAVAKAERVWPPQVEAADRRRRVATRRDGETRRLRPRCAPARRRLAWPRRGADVLEVLARAWPVAAASCR